jgi:hypothetical protein
MARRAGDNKAHASYHEGLTATSTSTHKRPTKQRAPFGDNNGTVQKRTSELHKQAHAQARKKSHAR